MIQSFLKYLTYERRYSQHTITSYDCDLKQFQKFISDNFTGVTLEDISYHHIRAWIIHLMEQDLNPGSVNRKIVSLRSFYKYLLQEGTIQTDPTTKVKVLKTPKKLPDFVQEEDMQRLLDHFTFDDDFAGWRDRLILELLYGTGIRLSELTGLKESDIDLFHHQIKVLGKRNKERIIPFEKNLKNIFSNYLDKKNSLFDHNRNEYLLVTDKGGKSYPMMIYRVVKKYLAIFTTVEKKSPHVLRHTFATHLLNKGADLNAVKDLLGHASLAATQVYTHNSLDKLKRVFDQAHPKA
ncbi:tyrosine-type recombinase/integrase [Fulvivirgaceae bacterium BMA12]|uniref:Tyrosine recombinase XerC n=1 Tax=Agaribacillus aureus TaxID=3051825 RepID=A0ABT8LHM2_9BACT|nr:tyrosine-type recombinase/integrase [Fulvivirgaceae bacterium BMA12]